MSSISEIERSNINQIKEKFLNFISNNYPKLKFSFQKIINEKALDNIKLNNQSNTLFLVIKGYNSNYNLHEKKNINSIVKFLKIVLQNKLFEKEIQKVKKTLKEAENDLKDSEEKNRRVIEALTDYIYTVPIKDGKPVDTIHGPACITVTGYTAAEFKKNPYLWIEMVYKEDFDIVKKHAELALSGKYSNSIEHRIIRKDGKIRWVRNTTVLHYDENNNFIAYDGIVQDITERKIAELALLDSEEKYRLLIESANDPINAVDYDGKCIYLNSVSAKYFGGKPKDFIGKRLNDFLPDKFAKEQLDIIRKVFSTGKGHVMELYTQTKLGDRWFIVNYQPIKDSSGKITMVLNINRDITERKLAELALLDSEERLRQIIKQMPYPIEIFDINGTAVLVNKAFIDLFGISNEKFVVNKYNVFKSPIFFEIYNISDMIKKAYKGETVNIPEFMIDFDRISYNNKIKKKGFLYLEVTMFPVFRKSGEIWRVVVIMKDITLRMIIENEKELLLHELASKNEELESVVYVSSHDLRTPLVNIQGFSNEVSLGFKQINNILQNSSIDKESKKNIDEIFNRDINESLNFIIKSVDKMDSLLKGLLRLSRLGREALDIKSIDMNILIKDIVKELQFQIQTNNVELIIDNLPECFGDYVQINQVFTNLIDNAIKYLDANKKGKIKITGKKENNQSIYSIIDNGVGIDYKYQKKIFEIFHRLNPNGNVKGEGLGLSIVKRIIDRHNGKIWVESKLGEGSTFFISLPCKINIK